MELLIVSLNVIFLLTISWWVWEKDTSSIRKVYWPAWGLKLVAGIAVGIIYSKYYADTDTLYFFNEGVVAAKKVNDGISVYLNYLLTTGQEPFLGEERAYFFIKITSLFCLLTNNNYWIVSLYFSFFSFVAAWWLTKEIVKSFPASSVSAVIAFLFFPSCIFWASGILKESMAMVSLFYLTGLFLKVWNGNKIKVIHVLGFVFFSWIGWNLKYYYLGILIPILFSAWITRRASLKYNFSKLAEVGFLLIVFSLFLFIISYMHPNFSFGKILNVIVSNNQAFVNLSDQEDIVHFYNLHASWRSMLVNSPWALFSGLFRPFVFEAKNLMQTLASIENLFILILVVMSIPRLFHIGRFENRLLIISILLYCSLLCIFLTLSSPNFGTLARYRVGFLPYLILLISNQPLIHKNLSKLL